MKVIVSVEDSGPLPVEIISPWTSSERISQQATSLKSPLVARVGTANEGCQAGQEMLLFGFNDLAAFAGAGLCSVCMGRG